MSSTFDIKDLDTARQEFLAGHVQEAMTAIRVGLQSRRKTSSAQAWTDFVAICQKHPLKEVLHQDAFTRRAFEKPRGYPGDASLMDLIYGQEDGWQSSQDMTELGQMLFKYTTAAPAPEGVRTRRAVIANMLDHLVETREKPHVLSLAAGHLRECVLSSAVRQKKLGRFVALDSDRESLDEVSRCYGRYGVETVPAGIRQILTKKLQFCNFDLVYSLGLFDYLEEGIATLLTSRMFDMLRAGGQILIANFIPDIPDVGYMESFMDWKLVYRTRQDMLALTTGIPLSEIRDIRIFSEENRNIIFLHVTKL